MRGVPVEEGKSYQLTIDPSWKSQAGIPLNTGMTKSFFATAADRTSPNHVFWKITSPASGSRDELIVDLGEQMDAVLLRDCLFIRGEKSGFVKGKVKLGNKASQWRFVPDNEWEKDKYYLNIFARLEDLGGNNLNRPFDLDLSKGNYSRAQKMYQRVFRIY